MSLVQEAQAGLSKASPTTAAPPATASPQAFVPHGNNSSGGVREDISAFVDTGPSPSPPPRPTPAPAPAQVSVRREGGSSYRGSGSKHGVVKDWGGDVAGRTVGGEGIGGGSAGGSEGEEDEVVRLVEWRDELLATGMYTAQNPIVSELNRRIELAGGSLGGGMLRREE